MASVWWFTRGCFLSSVFQWVSSSGGFYRLWSTSIWFKRCTVAFWLIGASRLSMLKFLQDFPQQLSDPHGWLSLQKVLFAGLWVLRTFKQHPKLKPQYVKDLFFNLTRWDQCSLMNSNLGFFLGNVLVYFEKKLKVIHINLEVIWQIIFLDSRLFLILTNS